MYFCIWNTKTIPLAVVARKGYLWVCGQSLRPNRVGPPRLGPRLPSVESGSAIQIHSAAWVHMIDWDSTVTYFTPPNVDEGCLSFRTPGLAGIFVGCQLLKAEKISKFFQVFCTVTLVIKQWYKYKILNVDQWKQYMESDSTGSVCSVVY